MKSKPLLEITEQMSDGFIALDKDGFCIHANIKALMLLKLDNLIGTHLFDNFPQIINHLTHDTVKQELKTREFVEIDTYINSVKKWYQIRFYSSSIGINIYFTETTAQQKVNQLELALRIANVGLWDWDLHTKEVNFSSGWKHQIGYEDHEISNNFQEWQSRIHPDDIDNALKVVQKFIASPHPDYHNEFRFRHKDGTYRWILAQADMVYDDNGEPMRMIGSHIDITNYKQIEAALELNEQRFRTLIEKSSDLLLLIGANEKTKYVSPAIETLLGYTAEEFSSLDRFDLVHPDDITTLMTHIQWSLEHPGEVIEGEHRVKHKDGSWRSFRRIIRNLLNDPAIHALVSNLSDISKRKQAEEELKDSESLFSNAFLIGPAGMTITRIADGKFIDANDSFCHMFEYKREEVIGHTSIELNMWTFEERQKIIREQVQAKGLQNFELVAQAKSGKKIHVLFSSSEIQIRDEACHLTTFIDISQRKKIEEDLRKSEDKYRTLIEHASDGIFVSDSHGYYIDVNTRGCAILGYSREELIGKHISEMVAPDNLAVQPLKLDDLKAGKSLVSERKLKNKDGSLIDVEISSKMLPDGNLLGMVRDISERKQMLEKLSNERHILRTLIDNLPHQIYQKDASGRFVLANKKAIQAWGIEQEEEMIGRTYADLAALQQKNQLQQFYNHEEEILQSGKSLIMDEVKVPMGLSGEAHYLSISKIPIQNNDGQITGIIGINYDITERKLAEQALREREQRFRLAMENIPDVVVIYDRNLTIQFINNATTKLTGRLVSDFIGRRDDEIWPSEVYKHYLPALKRTLNDKTNVSLETEIKISDSLSIYVMITCVPILDSENNVREILGITHDLTERKRAEQTLKRYNQRLTVLRQIDKDIIGSRSGKDIVCAVFNSLSELISYDRVTVILIDYETNEMITYSTQTNIESPLMAEQRHLMTHPQLATQMDQGHAVIIPDLRKLSAPKSNLVQQLIKEGQRSSISIPMLVQNMRIGSLNLSSKKTAYFTPEHEEILQEVANQLAIAIHQFSLYEQIEQMNQELEQRVIERTSQLEAKNRELETFTYTVSHDLKAPLRGIDGYSRLLLEDYLDELDEQGQTYLQNVRIATDQMNQLIDDLLVYSRLERRSLQTTSMNLRQISEAIVLERHNDVKEKSAIISITIPDMIASIDIDGFTMALRNLIDNALKFTQKDQLPNVEIGGYEDDGSCVLWIKDNGIGFDMKYHDRILQIFQRLHRAEEYPGTGIGLAIAQKAMERMGGYIRAESELGTGSIFYLEIPK